MQAAYILHAGSDFLHPEELAPHAKNNECVVIDVYKFGQEFFIIGSFWRFLSMVKKIPFCREDKKGTGVPLETFLSPSPNSF